MAGIGRLGKLALRGRQCARGLRHAGVGGLDAALRGGDVRPRDGDLVSRRAQLRRRAGCFGACRIELLRSNVAGAHERDARLQIGLRFIVGLLRRRNLRLRGAQLRVRLRDASCATGTCA